jgi:hypothetical protein
MNIERKKNLRNIIIFLLSLLVISCDNKNAEEIDNIENDWTNNEDNLENEKNIGRQVYNFDETFYTGSDNIYGFINVINQHRVIGIGRVGIIKNGLLTVIVIPPEHSMNDLLNLININHDVIEFTFDKIELKNNNYLNNEFKGKVKFIYSKIDSNYNGIIINQGWNFIGENNSDIINRNNIWQYWEYDGYDWYKK